MARSTINNLKISTTSAMLHLALGAGMLLMSVVAAFTVYYFVEGPIKVEIIVEVEEKSVIEDDTINKCDYNCSSKL